MEKKTMGSFMAALRKANGLTQQQVADKLNVSNKTISKWECSEGYPEISILPAIAELYSVSVDELLRGERIIKTPDEEDKDKGNSERIKYLIEKATVKIANHSIISIILGVAALLMAYTISDIIYNFNVLWVGYVIILLLCGASIAVSLIAFNNFISSLRNGDTVEKEMFEKSIKKSINYVSVTLFLATVTFSGLILNILLDGPSFLFAALPAAVVIGGITAYFIRSYLYKKYNVTETELSPEQKQYRKKHIKITSLILSLVIVLSVVSPFVGAFINTLNIVSYSFADGVGYQYSTLEEAEREYYKLKEYIIGDRALYNLVDEEYREDSDTYILHLEPIIHVFQKKKDVYELVESGVTFSEPTEFFSYEEAEKFKKEYVYNNEFLSIGELQKKVSLDDETLTVNYKWNTDYLNAALDIFPLFIIVGSCVCITVFIVSVAIYFKKKKN